MADICDLAQEQMELQEQLRGARPAYELAPGKPGNCDRCGTYKVRLVDNFCAPCRDELRLA